MTGLPDRASLLSNAAPRPPATTRDLLARISVAADIPPARRQALAADLTRFLELVPAAAAVRPHGACLRPHLERLHPVHTGVSEKRISNLRASIRACLRWSYATWPGAARKPEFSPAWADLRAQLTPRSKTAMWTSRLMHWANREGLEPEVIDDAAFVRFRNFLEATAALRKTLAHARQVARHWNMAADTVPGWPQARLTLPSTRTATRAPRAMELSAEIARELAGYAAFMRGAGQPHAPRKRQFRRAANDRAATVGQAVVYRDSTIAQREQLLRRAIGLLALERGGPVTDIKGLAELVAPGAPDAILERYDVELGDKDVPPPALRLMALAIYVMARTYLKADQDTLDRLGPLVEEAGPMQMGMTERNRARLRAITRAQFKALFRLPARLITGAARRVARGNASVSDLVDAQVGAAVAILLHAPVRGSNLAATRLGAHLILPPAKGEEGRLVYPAEMVKGGRPLDFPIPPDAANLLRLFITVITPFFPRSGFTDALFPGLKNGTKAVCHLGGQLAARVAEALGLQINQHFFRHLLAHVYLVRNPGRYEVVQHLLGHASVETTRRYYTGEEVEAALRDVARNLADLKLEFGLDPGDMSRLMPDRRGPLSQDSP